MGLDRMLLIAGLAALLLPLQPPQAGEPELTMTNEAAKGDQGGETFKEKVSYIIGIQMGSQARNAPVDLDTAKLLEGLNDALAGKPPRMNQQEMQQVMMQFQQKMEQEQQAKASANQKSAEAFLAENRKKEGVKVTESGIQYEVLKAGTGKQPTAEDKVTVHYRGTLPDGTEFDSSYKRGEPVSFELGTVIPGWREGVQLMKEGAKYRLAIPPALAYGAGGRPPVIPPNSALVFEIELISVDEKEGK